METGMLLAFSYPRRQNETSEVIGGEALVGKIEDAETRLEKQISNLTKGGWAVIGILLGWLALGTSYIVSMHGDIQAIKQYEKDHGGEIVYNIEHPKSSEQLVANLELAKAQMRAAQQNGQIPDQRKLARLQSAVAVAALEHDDLPEAWSAGAEIVSYRSQASHPSPGQLAPCDLTRAEPEIRTIRSADGQVTAFPGVFVSNCSLQLEDMKPIDVSKVGPLSVDRNAVIGVPVFLSNGVVRYHGGNVPSSAGFFFQNCIFEFETKGVPEGTAKDILIAALQSKDLDNVQAKG